MPEKCVEIEDIAIPEPAGQILSRFSALEEEVLAPRFRLSPAALRERCREARDAARLLRTTDASLTSPAPQTLLECRARGSCSGDLPCDVWRLARDSGYSVVLDSWRTAGGAVEFLGELNGGRRVIRVNMRPLRRIEERLRHTAVPHPWNGVHAIASVVAAHELYHGLRGAGGGCAEEAAAHAFARELLQMPFSPLLYEWGLAPEREEGAKKPGIVPGAWLAVPHHQWDGGARGDCLPVSSQLQRPGTESG